MVPSIERARRSRPLVLVSLAAIALSPLPAYAALSPTEKALGVAVDTDEARNEALLQRLVEVNSGTMNADGVTRVGRMMMQELEPLGFRVQWVPKAAMQRGGDIVARLPGDGHGRSLLLIGHLDTVFEPNSPFQHFTRKSGDLAEGPGAGDDKGGMVTMFAALRAMAKTGTLAGADITVVLTGDEEHSGLPLSESKRSLVEAARRSQVALDFEPLFRDAAGHDMGSTARRSSGGWTVTAQGRSGHSSLIFSQAFGDGAIYELARIVDRFRAELPEQGLTFNVGLITGGATAQVDPAGHAEANGKANIIPATAIASGDLRALTDEQAERAMAKMRAIVAAHLPGATATIRFGEGGSPAMPATPGDRRLLADMNRVNRDLGVPEMAELDPLERGAGDINHVARYLDCLSGLGAFTSGMHAPGETVDLASLRLQAKRAAILISRLAHSRR